MTRRALRLRPTGVVVLVLSGLFGLLWLGRSTRTGAAVMAVGLAATLVVDAVLAWLAVGAPRLEATAVEDADLDQPVRLRLRATHAGRPLQAALAGAGRTDRFLLPCPGEGVLPLVARIAGWHEEVDIDVEAAGPCGLVAFARRVRTPLGVPLVVGPPPIGHLYPPPPVRPVFVGGVPGVPTGRELTRGARPYRPGDPRRTVHWKATAHQGELMVKELEGSGAVRVRVVVAATQPGDRAVVAAGRATALVSELLAGGAQVELVTIEATTFRLGPLLPPGRPGSRVGNLPPYVTVEAPVGTPVDLRRRLARLHLGRPPVRGSSAPTRVVSDEGDRWL